MELIPGLPNDVAHECLIRISVDQLSKAASVCRAWNALIKQPEFCRRFWKASALTRPVIVMAQRMDGLTESDPPFYRLTLFEPVKRRWCDIPPIPEMVEGMPVFCSVVGIGPELAVIGGLDPVTRQFQNSVFIYNFLSATWRRGADMPGENRRFFGCAASAAEDGTVVVAGGENRDNYWLKSTLAYDVARDKWTTLSHMSIGRTECTCVFHRGKFHVLGGFNKDTRDDSKQIIETLDLVTRQWHITNIVTDYLIIHPQCTYVEIDEKIYTIKGIRDVVALEDTTWVFVTQVPKYTHSVAWVTGWQGNIMVIPSVKYGEAKRAYMLELKTKKWTKVKIPSEYRGSVQSSCCIHI
ncbi:PREDICTED: F-box/kelch-repeat protein At1g80440-like [Ipomoea nil]|uniref:F-box/kelch-repeat protein At1g80440-like n=1 Tax=Ipomoea nil TaxID=35883 RepID=UPI0009012CF0|nr:PREDICTED: F-box/kelch-repeat protein At1g80440-like [Ipomoea nil]